MSKAAQFTLNRDGIQYVAMPGFESGRDELGRILGEQPGLDTDDEIVELPSHMDEFSTDACLWNQVASAVYVGPTANGYAPDYSGGYVSRYDKLSEDEVALADELWLDPWDTSRKELTRLWCEQKYPEYFPTEVVTHEAITVEEAVIYSFCTDNWEFFHPELFDDGDETIGESCQSSVQHSDYIKELSWSAYKCEKKHESHRNGRCKYTWKQAGRVDTRTIRKIRKTTRTVEGRQQIAAQNDWMSANYWDANMADFDGDLSFYTDTPSGRLGDYYHRLLAVNHIDRSLKDEWTTDWAEFETSAQTFWRDNARPGYQDADARVRHVHIDYYRHQYARWPKYHELTDTIIHQHAENGAVAPGWHDYAEELLRDALAEPHLADMDLRDAMNDEYGDPALAKWQQPVHEEMTA